jgi:hypothetical protein
MRARRGLRHAKKSETATGELMGDSSIDACPSRSPISHTLPPGRIENRGADYRRENGKNMNTEKSRIEAPRGALILLLLILSAHFAIAQTTTLKRGKPTKVRIHIDGFSKSKSGAI